MRTYDPGEVVVIWGPHVLHPSGEDGVSVESGGEDWTTTRGVNGEVARARQRGLVSRVTLSLLQTDGANGALSAARNADLLTGQTVYPLLVKDNSGNSLHEAPEAFLEGAPETTYGGEAGSLTWAFVAPGMIHHHGGNDAA